jgi:hypothetical protein
MKAAVGIGALATLVFEFPQVLGESPKSALFSPISNSEEESFEV